jgi:uncharacterized membrane protein YgcG
MHVEQLTYLAQRHLIVIVVSQQQPLARIEVGYGSSQRVSDRGAITLADE